MHLEQRGLDRFKEADTPTDDPISIHFLTIWETIVDIGYDEEGLKDANIEYYLIGEVDYGRLPLAVLGAADQVGDETEKDTTI